MLNVLICRARSVVYLLSSTLLYHSHGALYVTGGGTCLHSFSNHYGFQCIDTSKDVDYFCHKSMQVPL